MSPPAPVPQVPALAELREAYESGELVILAGPGVSTAAGLPSHKQLVERLTDLARARGADPAALQEVAELAASRRYSDAFSALEECLGGPELRTALERLLDDRYVEESELARAITSLAPRLRAVLTTNVDHLLERAFAGRWPTLPRATPDVAQRSNFILKLHGTLLERSSWIFTRQDYDRAMLADASLHDTFTTLFRTVTLLFVGHGLDDPDFEWHLTRVRAFAGQQPPRLFVLVPASTVSPYRRKRLEDSGVKLIPYEDPDGKHAAAATVLRQLAAPDSLRTPRPASAARPLDMEDVRRLLREQGFSVVDKGPAETSRVLARAGDVLRLMQCLRVPCSSLWLGRGQQDLQVEGRSRTCSVN